MAPLWLCEVFSCFFFFFLTHFSCISGVPRPAFISILGTQYAKISLRTGVIIGYRYKLSSLYNSTPEIVNIWKLDNTFLLFFIIPYIYIFTEGVVGGEMIPVCNKNHT